MMLTLKWGPKGFGLHIYPNGFPPTEESLSKAAGAEDLPPIR